MGDGQFEASDGHRYQIGEVRLGGGGFGEVFLGRRADGVEVAIKRLPVAAGPGPGGNRELDIALKLGQEPRAHLLAPEAWARDGDDLLLVMPLASRSLATYLADRPGGLAADEQVAVLADVTRGLVELSAAGVVHRDLKPDNVLRYDGRWCLADFGISRDLDVRTATVTFRHHGTLPYVAPERWRGQPATQKSDLYALGCLAYEVCTGRRLFTGTPQQLQDQHLHAEVPTPPGPAGLTRWILRLLDKDPARRPQNADAALSALPGASAMTGGLANAALALQRRRHQAAVADVQLTSLAVARAAARRQALADLADLCATAAEHAHAQPGGPRGLAEDRFFAERPHLDAGAVSSWVRQRQPLTAEAIIDLLTQTLAEAARP